MTREASMIRMFKCWMSSNDCLDDDIINVRPDFSYIVVLLGQPSIESRDTPGTKCLVKLICQFNVLKKKFIDFKLVHFLKTLSYILSKGSKNLFSFFQNSKEFYNNCAMIFNAAN